MGCRHGCATSARQKSTCAGGLGLAALALIHPAVVSSQPAAGVMLIAYLLCPELAGSAAVLLAPRPGAICPAGIFALIFTAALGGPLVKQTYGLPGQTIERVFADTREKHGMPYTRHRSLDKVENRIRLRFDAMNLKKLATWRGKLRCLPPLFLTSSLFLRRAVRSLA